MKTTVLLHADEIARVLDRLACQIMERHGECEQTVLLGIQRRGVDLAVRLGKVLEGEIQELVDALVTHAQTEALKAQASS